MTALSYRFPALSDCDPPTDQYGRQCHQPTANYGTTPRLHFAAAAHPRSETWAPCRRGEPRCCFSAPLQAVSASVPQLRAPLCCYPWLNAPVSLSPWTSRHAIWPGDSCGGKHAAEAKMLIVSVILISDLWLTFDTVLVKDCLMMAKITSKDDDQCFRKLRDKHQICVQSGTHGNLARKSPSNYWWYRFMLKCASPDKQLE